MASSAAELAHLRAEIKARLGLELGAGLGGAGVESILQARRERAGGATASHAGLTSRELRALAECVTVGETYFFRYREQFEALAARLPTLGAGRPLRLLCAACSSGEEAGSLAILLRSVLPDERARGAMIVALDVNPAALRQARRGIYPEWSLRATPASIRARWFQPRGAEFELAMAARALVSVVEENLHEPQGEHLLPGAYDVVFCRNALMYFAKQDASAVIARLVRSLAPGGLLFLGPTETRLGQVPDLILRHSHGAFYHQRAEGSAPLAAAPRSEPARGLRSLHAPPGEAVARPIPPLVRVVDSAPASSSRALELLREERFVEALDALPAGGEQDTDTQLLRGVLLASTGDLAGAERACDAVLEQAPLAAGAHYLRALCREQGGDRDGAVEQDRAAIYLEPRFAMPHLHLGLLARRRGDLAEATRELRLAAALLAEEDETRLLLFGGGLPRSALVVLCRTELRACGVAA